jgi:hypothetical protein
MSTINVSELIDFFESAGQVATASLPKPFSTTACGRRLTNVDNCSVISTTSDDSYEVVTLRPNTPYSCMHDAEQDNRLSRASYASYMTVVLPPVEDVQEKKEEEKQTPKLNKKTRRFRIFRWKIGRKRKASKTIAEDIEIPMKST